MKQYNMNDIGKFWTPEQGKEYIIEIIDNEYTKENYKNKDGSQEIKDVMIYKISAMQEIGTNQVSSYDTPKEWKTASTKVHLLIQSMINEALKQGLDSIRVQIRRDNDNKYTVFQWTMPKF